jgi:hypothetical protein
MPKLTQLSGRLLPWPLVTDAQPPWALLPLSPHPMLLTNLPTTAASPTIAVNGGYSRCDICATLRIN